MGPTHAPYNSGYSTPSGTISMSSVDEAEEIDRESKIVKVQKEIDRFEKLAMKASMLNDDVMSEIYTQCKQALEDILWSL